MNIPIKYDRFVSQLKEANEWLDRTNVNEKGLHVQAIDTLALLTAICVEHFHKTGEVLLVKQHRSTADEADSLVQYVTINLLYCIITLIDSIRRNIKSGIVYTRQSFAKPSQ